MPHSLWLDPLSPAQLKRLEEHKYSASGRSLFEPPCQIFWNWLVQQIPTWIAPNTLTIVGLLVNVVSTVILVCYCPTATEEVSKVTLDKVSTPGAWLCVPSVAQNQNRPPFKNRRIYDKSLQVHSSRLNDNIWNIKSIYLTLLNNSAYIWDS